MSPLDLAQPPGEPVNTTVTVVRIPGGASYDPRASVLDDEKASARRPWPYNVRPKDFLISSGRPVRLPTNEGSTESIMLTELVQPALSATPAASLAVSPHREPDLVLLRYGGDEIETSPDTDLPPVATEDAWVVPAGMHPPSDKRARQKYFALRSQADKVRTTHPRQARQLDAQADLLMEPVIAEAVGRLRGPTSRVAADRQQRPVSVRDIDRRWLALQIHQITVWGKGTRQQRQRVRALLEMLLPVFAAAGIDPPSLPAVPEPLVLPDFVPPQATSHADAARADTTVDTARAA